MTPEDFEKLLNKFNDFRGMKTYHDTDIHTEHLNAYDHYTATRKGLQYEAEGLSFANFVAGYLKARQDAKQGNLL